MNKTKKLLEKQAAKLRSKLKALKAQVERDKLTRDELTDIEQQVEEVTEELQEINDAIEALPEDEAEELEETVEEMGEAADDVEETTDEAVEETDETVEPAERSKAMKAILSGISKRSKGDFEDKKQKTRKAFINFLAGRLSQSQARSLGVGFNNGSVLVPEDLSKEIITYLQEENPLRKFGTVHKTQGLTGFPVQVKQADVNIVETERDENGLIPDTDIEFDDVYLSPIEFDAIIKITTKLKYMSDFDVEAIVLDELKKAYLRKETFWYFSSPTNKGSLAKKAVAFETNATNDYVKLVQVKNALPTNMRSEARWMMNRAAQTLLETMLDDNGNPILKESGNADFDYRLFTYPVEVTDYTDKYDAVTKKFDPSVPIIYFGNFSYFHIQDVLDSMKIEILDQIYARENKIGYKIYHINDGELVYGPFETPIYKLDLTTAPAPQG